MIVVQEIMHCCILTNQIHQKLDFSYGSGGFVVKNNLIVVTLILEVPS